MAITTKSLLISAIFQTLDLPSVLSGNPDLDADVAQWFQQVLTSKDAGQAEIAAIIYSITQMYIHTEKDEAPSELFSNLLPLAFHGLHAGQMAEKLDKRSLYWFGVLIQQLVIKNDKLAASSKVKIFERLDLNLNAATPGRREH